MMPSVLPRTSREPVALFGHFPACTAALFSNVPRISMIASPITSSATLRVFECGALKTGTPRAAAASRSTWFVPMQKHPIAISRRVASSASAVTCVRLRMPTMCALASASFRSSRVSACPSRSTFV